MAEHTPKPWTIKREVDDSPGNYGVTRQAGPAWIPNNFPAGTPEGDQADADLYLIHAAPELLERCKLLREILSHQPKPTLLDWNWPKIVEDLDKVIARATGKDA